VIPEAVTGASGLAVALAWSARLVLAGLLAAICASDLRHRRIPNRLVLAGFAVALLWQAGAPAGPGLFHAVEPGGLGPGPALAGAAVAFGAFLALHLIGMMGAGDVKLVGMLGAVFGLKALPALVLSIFLVGGLLVAARMFDGTRRRTLLANLRLILYARLAAPGGVGPRFDPRIDTADRLPFGLAICGGAALMAGLQWSGWLR
jgi:prepilin peptidase CpaA